MVSGSSSARSGYYKTNIDQERQPSFEKSTRLANSGPEKCPEPKIERTVVKPIGNQQIIKKKIHTMIPKDQPLTYEDVDSGVSMTQDQQRKVTLKETRFQVVD